MNSIDNVPIAMRKTDRISVILIALYFLVSCAEIYAEYVSDIRYVYYTKPLIIPLLIFIYCRTSVKINHFYIVALVFSWIANIFFIRQTFSSIFIGAIFFFFHRALTIYVIIKHIRLPGLFPIVVGCMPFLFVYLYLVNLTYDVLGDGLPIFIVQCLIVSLLGGLSVGNIILRPNRAGKFLLLSTLLFAATQFIFVFRLYYVGEKFFQPLAMFLFVTGQYIFYRFLILSERDEEARSVLAPKDQ